MIKLKKVHWIALISSLVIIIGAIIFLRDLEIFYFIIGIAIVISIMPFFVSNLIETGKIKEKDRMFLEFARNLAESVNSGTPISKSIVNLKNKDYGVLNKNISKLADQITLGIPVKTALNNFSKDAKSRVISRAITLIREAEKAGGDVGSILDAVADSVNQTEELKKQRRAAIYSLIIQGYIIFLIFIVIILVLQFKLLPMVGDISNLYTEGIIEGVTPRGPEDLTIVFLYLLVTQGFFTGLTIGKLAEGTINAGLKHSFILMMISILISTGAKAFF